MSVIWTVILIAAVLVLLYLFLIAPRFPRRDMSALTGHWYAHRGLWNGERPENSLPAFRAAVEGGYGIETDVHITRDDRLVVFHDDTLTRMCGSERKLSDCTLAELREYRLQGTDCLIPTLDEFLETVAGRVPVLVEIKSDQRVALLCEKLNERLNSYHGTYMIESFDPRAVAWFRKNRPEVLRGQLSTALTKPEHGGEKKPAYMLVEHLFTNIIARPDFIAYDFTERKIPELAICRKVYGVQEVSWTIRTPEDAAAAEKLGNLVIFENFGW